MKEKNFLIYLDILGFKDLPREISEKTGFDENIIRERFFSKPLEEKIKEIAKDGVLHPKGVSVIEGSDNYVLLLDNDIHKAFKILAELVTIKIPHKDYGFIPLEIAVDFKQIEIVTNNPINQNEVIEFLKNDIINPYRKKHKEAHAEQSITEETFILFTNVALDELQEHHKKECKEYSYQKKDKDGIVKEQRFFCIPLTIIKREKNISDYFKKIQQSRSDYNGALIDKLFVPPDEFDDIKNKLKNERIVFLTGTAGYGKTYTTIRLLWEWFNNGYVPKWIPGKEPEDRKVVRDKLANIDAILEPHHVVYFEDPFGKTIYERREDLKERINFIIRAVKNKDDTYVLITSRKDVFEEFEKESYSVEEIKKFENELNILKPSYSYDKRKEILEKWAEEKGCLWLKGQRLKEIVFDSINDIKNLPTPLSIHDFTEATVKTVVEKDLRRAINDYSKIIERAFADEIIDFCSYGKEDRVLFLSIVFVLRDFGVHYIKQVYEKLKKEDFKDFERILKEEYRIKEVTRLPWIYRDSILEFSHPSYSNALPYMLEDKTCKDKFCEVLREVSLHDSAAADIVRTVAENSKNLPEDLRNELLLKLTENDRITDDIVAESVASAMRNNFENLPEFGRNKLLLKLSERHIGAIDVATTAITVAENFDKIPEDVRNELLFKLPEKYGGACEVIAVFVRNNFKNLPEHVRNKLLFKLLIIHFIDC